MEVWKDIPNYEGMYQVSNLGRVKSLKRKVNHRYGTRTVNERVLKNNKDSTGYYNVNLGRNGKSKVWKIHQLVAIAFLNHELSGNKVIVDHIDNDKSNNKLKNLQLTTPRHNNSKDKKGFSSKYTGVCWHKASEKWAAKIYIDKKPKHLGTFICELEAHEAYQKELLKINI